MRLEEQWNVWDARFGRSMIPVAVAINIAIFNFVGAPSIWIRSGNSSGLSASALTGFAVESDLGLGGLNRPTRPTPRWA